MASVATIRTARVNEITRNIIGAAIKAHSALGPGLLESAYEACLLFELHKAGLRAEAQVPRPVVYEQVRIDLGHRLDLMVEDTVIVELKSVDAINPVQEAQLLSYLTLSRKPVGLIVNFNVLRLKDGIRRIVSGTDWE
jgi:GxxExxY protein